MKNKIKTVNKLKKQKYVTGLDGPGPKQMRSSPLPNSSKYFSFKVILWRCFKCFHFVPFSCCCNEFYSLDVNLQSQFELLFHPKLSSIRKISEDLNIIKICFELIGRYVVF